MEMRGSKYHCYIASLLQLLNHCNYKYCCGKYYSIQLPDNAAVVIAGILVTVA